MMAKASSLILCHFICGKVPTFTGLVWAQPKSLYAFFTALANFCVAPGSWLSGLAKISGWPASVNPLLKVVLIIKWNLPEFMSALVWLVPANCNWLADICVPSVKVILTWFLKSLPLTACWISCLFWPTATGYCNPRFAIGYLVGLPSIEMLRVGLASPPALKI